LLLWTLAAQRSPNHLITMGQTGVKIIENKSC
jgi:hypothetical protein